ncbi:MAG: hypothetical protein ABJN22_09720 [Litorimonas sp.]
MKTACLILDGLDEISGTSHGPLNALNQLISSLEKEQTVCAAHDKNLIVFALGRDSHIQFASNQIASGRSTHFELLSLDGRFRNDGLHSEIILGDDLRPMWWRKYLTATGRPVDPSLPDFLTTDYDDFSEFGSDPLLTYLICRTALENLGNTPPEKLPHESVNEFTYAVREIKSGEQLTWGYRCSENSNWVLQNCLCNSDRCTGSVANFDSLPAKMKSEYLSKSMVSEWIVSRLEN